jgi:hypothetical protein
MKKAVTLEFSELGEMVPIELHDSHSPKTVRAIIDKLPIRTTINRWGGDELYTDETPVNVIGRMIIIIIITSMPKPANVQAFLKSVEEAHVSKKVPVVLR